MPSLEPTSREILEAIQALAITFGKRFDTIDQRFAEIDEHFLSIAQSFQAADDRFTSMDSRFNRMEFEMRTGFADIRSEMVTKQDHAKAKSELMTEIDSFIVLHHKIDLEQVSLLSRSERSEAFMKRVAKRLHLEFQPA